MTKVYECSGYSLLSVAFDHIHHSSWSTFAKTPNLEEFHFIFDKSQFPNINTESKDVFRAEFSSLTTDSEEAFAVHLDLEKLLPNWKVHLWNRNKSGGNISTYTPSACV